jgi:hypothetical protein
VPRHLQQALAEEEDDGGIVGGPGLTADGQAQYIAVEAPGPVQVDRAQQDTAAEYLYPAILAAQAKDRTASTADDVPCCT